jgi:hypothetical protein
MVERKVDVVAARADHVERVRVCDAAVRVQIIFDLRDGGHSLVKKVGDAFIVLIVAGAAGRKVGATRLIGRNGGGAEKAREQLARHQAWAARCTPGTLLNRVREQGIEVVAASREWIAVFIKVVAVPARVDGAVTEANELIDGLCSSRARDRNGSSERKKTQYMIHAMPPQGNFPLRVRRNDQCRCRERATVDGSVARPCDDAAA